MESFVFKQTEDPQSLYWLLEEPLVRGARLDLSANGLFPGLNKALVDKVVTLGQLLETAGLDLKDDEAIAQRLGFKSTRLVAQLLLKWRAALKPTEWSLLSSFRDGLSRPNPTDSFPHLFFSVNVEGFAGIFWRLLNLCMLIFYLVLGKHYISIV